MTLPTRTRNRPSLAAEDRDLARQVGARIKAARTAAGLTQRELAAPRYTKAYVSALENGLIKPSLAALRFLAGRLGTVPEAFLADRDTQWLRVEAELRLAAGDWVVAADRFQAILDGGVLGVGRGMALVGLAEASYRLGRARDAIAAGTEARELLQAADRPVEARRATYWLAAGHHLSDDPARARMLFEEILVATTAETADADLRVRTLVALATVMSYAGEAEPAMALLAEARGIGADLDDRRRATLLHSLAQTYRKSGDLEGAIRTGIESLALFRAVDAHGEAAMTENELALIFLGLGNLAEADRHAVSAITDLQGNRDDFHLAHVEDTAAQIALARGDLDEAEARAERAARLAEGTANHKALIDACLTTARAARRRGDPDAAIAALQRASEVAADGPPAWLRRVLTDWSEVAAEAGDHAAAYALSRRALALS